MWTPLGKPGSKAASLRFDAADYLLRVRAVADDYNTTHDILAVFVENAAAEFRSQLNGCDIANVDGCACRRGQDDVLKVLPSIGSSRSPERPSPGRLLQ